MYKFSKKILPILLSVPACSYGGILMDDIDYRYYLDFANNTGLFKPGSKNIHIYYKDSDILKNDLSKGYLGNVNNEKSVVANDIPMPSFRAVSRKTGTQTLIDPQIYQSNKHTIVNRGQYNNFGTVDHYDNKNLNGIGFKGQQPVSGNKQLLTVFKSGAGISYATGFASSKKYKTFWNASQFDLGAGRLSKIVTDVAPAKLLNVAKSDEGTLNGYRISDKVAPRIYKNYKAGYITHMYRVGAGGQIDINNKKLAKAYNVLTGGVYNNPSDLRAMGHQAGIKSQWEILKKGLYGGDRNIHLGMPLVTQPGDSGSPIFGYVQGDPLNEDGWYLLGTLHGSRGNYNTYSPMSAGELEYYKKFFQADEIKNTSYLDGDIKWSNGMITQGDNLWGYYKINDSEIGKLVHNMNAFDLRDSQDIIFSGDSGLIKVAENINSGAGSITFNNDYTVEGEDDNNSYIGSGLIINGDSVVNWKLKGVKNDNLHKIGTGTLIVNGKGINNGGLRVGDGTVILKQEEDENGNKQSFSEVIIASGRPVVILGGEGQIDGKNIFFVSQGGTLDLNGYDIEFDRIRHVDDGATIRNKNAHQKSTLNINGNFEWGDGKYRQIYKGFIGGTDLEKKELLDINFNTINNKEILALAGGINIDGDINSNNGHLIMSGNPIYFSYHNSISSEASNYLVNKNYVKDFIDDKTYVFNNATVSNKGKLEIGYSSSAYGNINVFDSELLIGKNNNNTYCIDIDGLNGPLCKKNDDKLYSNNLLNTFYYGNVTLSNNAEYNMGLSVVKGKIKDLDNSSSLKMENGANFILEGDDNQISKLTINDSHVFLNKNENGNENAKLKIGSLVSKNSDFTFDINRGGNEDPLLSIDKLIDSELKFNVYRNTEINNPIDYTKKIMLASIQEIKNSDIILDSDDIGLYKFKVNNTDKIYYLEAAKGIQKNIISDLTNDIVISQSATNNVIEKHMFSSSNNFKKNDGLWISNEFGRLWYNSNESYRNFNQNHNEFNIGYNHLLSKGRVGASYSNINSNTNKNTTIKSNFLNIYGEYHLNKNNNIYLMASMGKNKAKINSLDENKNKKDTTQGYLIGISNTFYRDKNFTSNIYLDAAFSKSSINNNHNSIQFKNNTNYWLSSGVEMKNSIESDYIKQYNLVSRLGYSHNFSSDDEIMIQSQAFKVEKNKYNVNVNSGIDFQINDNLVPYLSIDLSVGDKYRPATQANVGVRYIF
ncbi:autotransporter outer membrane beta-barrel domain-containing protein [Providencia rettgeri]